jgi:hypothetical protein
MLGKLGPARLPNELKRGLLDLHTVMKSKLGGIRVEWAYDGNEIWVIQLQQIQAMSTGRTIVPGECDNELLFTVKEGLPALRELITKVGRRTCICLVGEVGMTSHSADVPRRSRVPSRIA